MPSTNVPGPTPGVWDLAPAQEKQPCRRNKAESLFGESGWAPCSDIRERGKEVTIAGGQAATEPGAGVVWVPEVGRGGLSDSPGSQPCAHLAFTCLQHWP